MSSSHIISLPSAEKPRLFIASLPKDRIKPLVWQSEMRFRSIHPAGLVHLIPQWTWFWFEFWLALVGSSWNIMRWLYCSAFVSYMGFIQKFGRYTLKE